VKHFGTLETLYQDNGLKISDLTKMSETLWNSTNTLG